VRFAVAAGIALAAGLAMLAVVAGRDQSDLRPPTTWVVSISVRSGGASNQLGTGFTAGAGRVVTVAHLVEGASTVTVRRAGPGAGGADRGIPLRARVLRLDPRTDLALLAAPGLRAPPLHTARDGERARLLVRRGDRTVTLAAPVRRQIVAHVRTGTASAPPKRRSGLELEARIEAGDSGAPVIAPGGEVMGVVFARSRSRPGTAYAVGAAAVARLVGRSDPPPGRPAARRRCRVVGDSPTK
jgi:S1-C subfamily serine protease